MSKPPAYRFKKGTTVKTLTEFCIPEGEAAKLLRVKSFPHEHVIFTTDPKRFLPHCWHLPDGCTELVPSTFKPSHVIRDIVAKMPFPKPSALAAPRWRVYPAEKPIGNGSIYIAHFKDGAMVEIDCATGSFYRNMEVLKNLSTATTYWPYWMPESEAIALFPPVPKP